MGNDYELLFLELTSIPTVHLPREHTLGVTGMGSIPH